MIECFQQGSRDAEKPGTQGALRQNAALGRPLLCARCKQAITTTAARIEVAGSHEHLRTNPHGFEYQFGCFAEAPGCLSASWPSSEFAWFPGYTWQVGRCERCREHLGWRFASADHVFFGLILDRLVDGESEAEGP